MGRDVGASLLEPVQGLGVAEREGGLQAGTVVEFGVGVEAVQVLPLTSGVSPASMIRPVTPCSS